MQNHLDIVIEIQIFHFYAMGSKKTSQTRNIILKIKDLKTKNRDRKKANKQDVR